MPPRPAGSLPPRPPDNNVELAAGVGQFCIAARAPGLVAAWRGPAPLSAPLSPELTEGDVGAEGHLLELLDAEEHHALQVWPLDAAFDVTLGRARTNTVVVASPLVSRAHARLRFLDGCWILETISALGVWSRGELRSRLALADGAVFRLGEHGPALRLMAAAPRVDFDAESTIRVRAGHLGFLQLDTTRRDREVAEIAASEFFQSLARRAGSLRARARGETDGGSARAEGAKGSAGGSS